MSTSSSLSEYIDRKSLECLNEDSKHKCEHILTSDTDFYLESSNGVSEQLLIKIKFNDPVKIDSLIVKGLPNSTSDGTAPKVVRLFINDPDLDFQDAESSPCVQELNLEKEHVEDGERIPLRYVRFQNVSVLVLFIAENYGNDITRISYINAFGTANSQMKIENWKPTQEQQ